MINIGLSNFPKGVSVLGVAFDLPKKEKDGASSAGIIILIIEKNI
jgi:hypothetical protein